MKLQVKKRDLFTPGMGKMCTLGAKVKRLEEFDTYIRNNAEFIPNYGERRRYGETISTAFVKSAVNQVVSNRMVKIRQHKFPH